MADQASKILILVEGARTDLRLMKHLLHIYNIDKNHQVVSYNTNIYSLYNEMFRDDDPASIDILQLLKERESDPSKKQMFNEYYSDILLVFDLDPQDRQFSGDKIVEMMQFFVESSDMGKLYLNYPMVEAFYHMKEIPDEYFINYEVQIDELKSYKQRVNRENRNHSYSKFAINRDECNIVILQNIDKAWNLSELKRVAGETGVVVPGSIKVLKKQLKKIEFDNVVSVLCTCAFYIVDYNPKFVLE